MRSSRPWSGSNSKVSGRLRSVVTSTVFTSRISRWSATALTGRLAASRTLKRMLVDSGTSAPRQRRGRKGLIGVSASIAESSGRIDRKSVGEGKSVLGRVDLGGRRIIKKKKQKAPEIRDQKNE